MLTCIATVSLSGTLEEKIDAIAEAGFDGLEIFENDLVTCPLTPREIRERCDERLLYVDLYQPFRDFESVSDELFHANLLRAEGKLALARELGASTMLVCANVATATVDDDAVAVSQLRALGDLAESYGVRIAYEALAWSTYVSTYERSWEIVQAVDHPYVGLCLDSFHIMSAGSTLDAISTIPGDKIFFCQLADAPAMSLDPLSWSRHFRVFPGEGSFDLRAFVTEVFRTGYEGPLSLEIFNDVFRQSDPRRTAVDGLRSLRFLQDTVARGAEEPLDAARRLVQVTRIQDVGAVDFLELRSRNEPELLATLASLGFRHRGRHTSKDVDLWEQGAVRVVVNETAPTPPRPTLAAIGLQVADADAAARRADQLLAPRVERATRPDEVVLRAVAAPDTTEVYFSDARSPGGPAWTAEFTGATDSADATTTGIVGVDHIALAQPWQHFDEAVLFYRSIVGLEPSSSVDVADPSGLVRSQVMASPSGALRLVLNVLPTSLTDGARGAGHAEHIAFTSDDLLHTARTLQARGVPALDIPGNYYADLRARFDLPLPVVEELESLQVLYDRDASGTFLQLYTRVIGDMFFEVVQRTGGYSGFGAANAPVRRAAQRRAKPAATTGAT